MATVVEFECPSCRAACSHPTRGEVVRCPHCFSFVTVPGDEEPPQIKAARAPEEEAATIIFSCPHCQSRIETDPANAGLACLCPGCRVGLTIPGTASPIFVRSPEPLRPWESRRPVFDSVMATIILALVAISGLLLLVGLIGREP